MNEFRRVVSAKVRDIFYPLQYPQLLEPHFNTKFLYLFNKYNLEILIMSNEAVAKKGRPTPVKPVYEAIAFVNRNLTDEEKADHDARNEPIANLALSWIDLALSGYTCKLSFDSYSKCYQATLTVWNEACSNYGYGLSARGATPKRALSLLLYKHFHVLKENWAAAYKPPTSSHEG